MSTESNGPILITGAAGRVGAVGRTVTGLLLDRGLPVRALIRRDDDRAAALRAAGAEVVVGDLLDPADVFRAVEGSRRVYFGLSVSPGYLEATVTVAAVTALTNAVWAGDKEVVQLLLVRGADTDVTGGKFYPTILDYAVEYSSPEIVELLRKAGAKMSDRRPKP